MLNLLCTKNENNLKNIILLRDSNFYLSGTKRTRQIYKSNEFYPSTSFFLLLQVKHISILLINISIIDQLTLS